MWVLKESSELYAKRVYRRVLCVVGVVLGFSANNPSREAMILYTKFKPIKDVLCKRQPLCRLNFKCQ